MDNWLVKFGEIQLSHKSAALVSGWGYGYSDGLNLTGITVICVVLPVSGLGPETVHFTDPSNGLAETDQTYLLVSMTAVVSTGCWGAAEKMSVILIVFGRDWSFCQLV